MSITRFEVSFSAFKTSFAAFSLGVTGAKKKPVSQSINQLDCFGSMLNFLEYVLCAEKQSADRHRNLKAEERRRQVKGTQDKERPIHIDIPHKMRYTCGKRYIGV